MVYNNYSSQPTESWHRSSTAKPGEIISFDPAGIINPCASNGHKYFWLFKDVATGYCWTITSKDKSSETCIAALDHVIIWLRTHQFKTYLIRTDSEIILDSASFKAYAAKPENSFLLQKSIPYKHEQNAVKRDMQTVVQGAALLMAEQPWLRKDNCDLALFHYVDLRNRMPNSHSPHFQGRSPHHIMTGLPCDLQREYKFQFGDLVACNIPKDLKDFKFDTRNQLAIYVGEEENTKGGHIIYWPYTKSTTVRDDCVKLHISDAQFLHYYSKLINAKVKTLPYMVVEQALRDFEEVSYDFIIDNLTPLIAEADPAELANLSKSLSVCLFDSISYDTSSISTPTVSPSTELYHKYPHVHTSPISTPKATELNHKYPRSHTPSISTPISVKPTDLSFTHSHRRVRFSDPIDDDTYENTTAASWRNLTSIRPPSEPPPLSQSETDAAIDHFMLAHCHPAFSTNKTTVTKALKGPQSQEWLKQLEMK